MAHSLRKVADLPNSTRRYGSVAKSRHFRPRWLGPVARSGLAGLLGEHLNLCAAGAGLPSLRVVPITCA